MQSTINTIESCTDIPDYMRGEEIRMVTLEDEHFSALAELVLHCWPSTKA